MLAQVSMKPSLEAMLTYHQRGPVSGNSTRNGHESNHYSTFEDRLHIEHYVAVIMSAMASQIASISIVYSLSGVDQRKHQSSVSLAFVRRNHRWKCFHLMTSFWITSTSHRGKWVKLCPCSPCLITAACLGHVLLDQESSLYQLSRCLKFVHRVCMMTILQLNLCYKLDNGSTSPKRSRQRLSNSKYGVARYLLFPSAKNAKKDTIKYHLGSFSTIVQHSPVHQLMWCRGSI